MSVIGSIALLALGAIFYLALGWHDVGAVLMVIGVAATVVSVIQLALLTRGGRRPPTQPM